MQFHICNLSFGVFDEVQRCLIGALRRQGHHVTHAAGILQSGDEIVNISLALFRMPEDELRAVTHHIVYNFEQFGANIATPIRQSYFRIMRQAFVWDYSQAHLAVLKSAGISECAQVAYRYAPELSPSASSGETHSPPVAQDIDVLFYGALTPRRVAILDELRRRGLVVRAPTTQFIWGDERRELMARSKLLLNIGTFEAVHTLESVRLAPWFAEGKCVVSELRPDSSRDIALDGCYVAAEYGSLADACEMLLNDGARRHAQEIAAQRIFTSTSFDDAVAGGVSAYLAARQARGGAPVRCTPTSPPRRLRSCEHADVWSHDALNVAPDVATDPDVVIDLSRRVQPGSEFDTWRFGRIRLQAGYFDRIDWAMPFATTAGVFAFLENCRWLLRGSGIVNLTLPFAPSDSSWRQQQARHSSTPLTADEHFLAMWRPVIANQAAALHLEKFTHNLDAEAMHRHRQGEAWAAIRATPGAVASITFTLRQRSRD